MCSLPVRVRIPPEIFCRSLAIRTSRSARLVIVILISECGLSNSLPGRMFELGESLQSACSAPRSVFVGPRQSVKLLVPIFSFGSVAVLEICLGVVASCFICGASGAYYRRGVAQQTRAVKWIAHFGIVIMLRCWLCPSWTWLPVHSYPSLKVRRPAS